MNDCFESVTYYYKMTLSNTNIHISLFLICYSSLVHGHLTIEHGQAALSEIHMPLWKILEVFYRGCISFKWIILLSASTISGFEIALLNRPFHLEIIIPREIQYLTRAV